LRGFFFSRKGAKTQRKVILLLLLVCLPEAFAALRLCVRRGGFFLFFAQSLPAEVRILKTKSALERKKKNRNL
jgi:hypothetical protein